MTSHTFYLVLARLNLLVIPTTKYYVNLIYDYTWSSVYTTTCLADVSITTPYTVTIPVWPNPSSPSSLYRYKGCVRLQSTSCYKWFSEACTEGWVWKVRRLFVAYQFYQWLSHKFKQADAHYIIRHAAIRMFGSWTQGTTLLVKEPQNVASAGKWFYVLGKETSFRAYWIVTCKSAVLTHTQHEINMKRWGFLSLCNWKPWEGDWKWSYNYRKSPTTVSLIGCEESPSVWLPKYTYITDINTHVCGHVTQHCGHTCLPTFYHPLLYQLSMSTLQQEKLGGRGLGTRLGQLW